LCRSSATISLLPWRGDVRNRHVKRYRRSSNGVRVRHRRKWRFAPIATERSTSGICASVAAKLASGRQAGSLFGCEVVSTTLAGCSIGRNALLLAAFVRGGTQRSCSIEPAQIARSLECAFPPATPKAWPPSRRSRDGGLGISSRAPTAREDRRSDSKRILTGRRNGVGSSRWDFHKRQTPPGDAPSNHRGTRPVPQPRSPGRPCSRAARRKSGRKNWLLHCRRWRRSPRQRRRRHRQRSPNSALPQAALPIRKLPALWQQQVRAQSCSWSSPAYLD